MVPEHEWTRFDDGVTYGQRDIGGWLCGDKSNTRAWVMYLVAVCSGEIDYVGAGGEFFEGKPPLIVGQGLLYRNELPIDFDPQDNLCLGTGRCLAGCVDHDASDHAIHVANLSGDGQAYQKR
jgi:hypothetical protein